MKKTVTIEVISGSAGDSLYINEYRVAGVKPWGGGKTIATWKIDRERLLQHLIEADVLEKPPTFPDHQTHLDSLRDQYDKLKVLNTPKYQELL